MYNVKEFEKPSKKNSNSFYLFTIKPQHVRVVDVHKAQHIVFNDRLVPYSV
ncbi:hypothetical protein NCCP2222_20370 [Sporosarcina sp. NCCP-2222]|nr:hypothetical protein NCCP2222_20370 [Sporosarcina sp. NCCP-2222]